MIESTSRTVLELKFGKNFAIRSHVSENASIALTVPDGPGRASTLRKRIHVTFLLCLCFPKMIWKQGTFSFLGGESVQLA